jgi:DnaJ-class molecular chaperone
MPRLHFMAWNGKPTPDPDNNDEWLSLMHCQNCHAEWRSPDPYDVQACPDCGVDNWGQICGQCNTEGGQFINMTDVDGTRKQTWQSCPHCAGLGYIIWYAEPELLPTDQ